MTTIDPSTTRVPAALPRSVAGSVLAVGVLWVLGSLAWARMPTLSVALGSAVALLHLWSVAHWVKRALGTETVRLTWVLFSLVKLVVFFFGLAWLARNQVIAVLPFLLGYSALPLGILAAQLLGPVWLVLAPQGDQSAREQTGKVKG
jgi:hypothetical protein